MYYAESEGILKSLKYPNLPTPVITDAGDPQERWSWLCGEWEGKMTSEVEFCKVDDEPDQELRRHLAHTIGRACRRLNQGLRGLGNESMSWDGWRCIRDFAMD